MGWQDSNGQLKHNEGPASAIQAIPISKGVADQLRDTTLLLTSVCLHWVFRRLNKIDLPVASAVRWRERSGFAACLQAMAGPLIQ